MRIGRGLLDALLAEHPDRVVIADAFFADRLAAHGDRVLTLPAEESHKTLSEVERLIEELRDRGVARGDHLLAVGGGIVQDVATGVASLYMRGLDWTYAPSTLLGMADSCIGGKSSLNAGRYKNLAGNFHPPASVVIDVGLLDTLPAADRAGGLCEAMKISFCRGPEAFATYEQLHDRLDADQDAIVPLLHHVLDQKRWFIEVDEFDRKERRLLNFGHTFAHAIEPATSFEISHGIAVGIGVLCAERIGADAPDLAAHAKHLVLQDGGVGERLGQLDRDHFERAFLSDKKHGADGLHVIVPVEGGGVEERVLPRDDATLATIHDAVTTVAEGLRG